MEAVSSVERAFDFIVIDTPGSDSYPVDAGWRIRWAGIRWVTPINDSSSISTAQAPSTPPPIR